MGLQPGDTIGGAHTPDLRRVERAIVRGLRDEFGKGKQSQLTHAEGFDITVAETNVIIEVRETPPDDLSIDHDAGYWRKMYEERMALQEDGFSALLGERDRYRDALLSLHRTAERLMVSENEDERGMGCAMAEVTRIVIEPPET